MCIAVEESDDDSSSEDDEEEKSVGLVGQKRKAPQQKTPTVTPAKKTKMEDETNGESEEY